MPAGTADERLAPSLGDIERLAQAAYDALPPIFRKHCKGLLIRVDDFADDETLAEMEIDDAYEVTGLYQGVALTEKSVMDIPGAPDTIWLFRRPIVDEWVDRGDVTLAALVAHVLIHEIAHHFGYSDDDIAAIDDWRL
jgi:predicted Zn-dependent protease with MMP-like domain